MTDAGGQDPIDAAVAELAVLRRQFAQRLPTRLASIETLFGRLSPQRWNPDDAQALHRMVHSLSGTAGIFGMPSVSAAARQVEPALFDLIRGTAAGSAPSESAWQQVSEGVRGLLAQTRVVLEQVGELPDEAPAVEQAPAAPSRGP